MKKGEIHEFEIESYAFEGKGICKVAVDEDKERKKVVFIQGAYPGDVVKAEVRRVKRSYIEARTVEIVKPSEDRVEARCIHFGTCGGCKQQNLKYEVQAAHKRRQVAEVFNKIGGFDEFKLEPIIAAEDIWFYRNKMEYSFSDKRWLTKDEIGSEEKFDDRDFALGLHIPRMFDKVFNLNECFLQNEISAEIVVFTREFFRSRNISIYQTRTHEGFLRNLVIRISKLTNDLMVNLVTSYEDEKLLNEYALELEEKFPAVTTFVNNINLKKALVAYGDYEKVFFGSGYIYDIIGKYKYRISANSFFQTNTMQAEKLYQTALEFASPEKTDIVYDLYSGAGTISLFISEHVKTVHGFEDVEPAVNDAEMNKQNNDVENVHFHQANLNKSFLPKLEENKIPKPDLVIADPPRGGMNPKTVNDLLKLKPPKIVYVSCNPATQARDVKLLCEGGYELIKMQPVDMFPHTFHIENVALLQIT
ncbi:MAG: 23S rRNA (uracil(1939)-C(5))-methyltransferase RlmD [Ignavibacteriae bacterium]|nr:23S rRNA (uracil(1939)-C(5))-methyltransferase RlmD [Ignavibacteriota bacterium]NOH00145.1 23S rRNA (uracil(1939)-C(5))-methyltransferase RlmD [Ignavibacteriota bacterium]